MPAASAIPLTSGYGSKLKSGGYAGFRLPFTKGPFSYHLFEPQPSDSLHVSGFGRIVGPEDSAQQRSQRLRRGSALQSSERFERRKKTAIAIMPPVGIWGCSEP